MAKDLLDLHGYQTSDVFDAVDEFLVKLSSTSKKRARIMPGKGTGKVKNLVIDYLKKANYPWQFEKMPNGKENQGVIVVFLD